MVVAGIGNGGAVVGNITFVQRGVGDVLLSWENEAHLAISELGADKLEIVSKGSLEAKKNADDATMKTDRRAEIIVLKTAK